MDEPDHDSRMAAALLLWEMATDRWGHVSTSVYETSRLVSLAPWLTGHAERVAYLCDTQDAQGAWGDPDGYAVVPTLSATEALLATLRQPAPTPLRQADRDRATAVARRGLDTLLRWLAPGTTIAVPDTIAVEVVLPALVARINRHLEAERIDPSPGLPRWPSDARLALPPGFHPDAPAALRARLEVPNSAPQTWWASLEALGPTAVRAITVRPADGAVACSPAATAAWLGDTARASEQAVRYLDRLQARGGGPVPGVTPITFFERAWVLTSLADAGLESPVAGALLDDLESALGATGAPAAPGLPADCDDGAVVLTTLGRYGRHRSAYGLLAFRAERYLTCFPGERTPSTSTNAHALQALDAHAARRPVEQARFAPVADMVSAWLLDTQRPDGSWLDKWHASAYYATSCCVLALAQRPTGRLHARTLDALGSAMRWVLGTQRPDGSWGRWTGTVEETAYAIRVLATVAPTIEAGALLDAVRCAVMSGAAFLRPRAAIGEHPGLWHAKDLYAPLRVIRAVRLAALADARVIARQMQHAAVAAAPAGGVGAAWRTHAPQPAGGQPIRSGTAAATRRR